MANQIITALPGREINSQGHDLRKDPHGDGLTCQSCQGYWGITYLMSNLEIDLGPCAKKIFAVPASYRIRH